MAKIIGATIAIALVLSGATAAEAGGEPIGVGAGTVAMATPTGLVAGTIATETPTATSPPSPTPTQTVIQPTATYAAIIAQGDCAIPTHGRPQAAWWLMALPFGVTWLRRRRRKAIARSNE